MSVKATDAGGSATSKTLSFKVSGVTSNPYAEHGFLRVSKTDPRYFEFQDGTTFIGAGYNDGFGQAGQSEQQMQMLEQNRMDFARTWLSGSGINGSQWTAWGWNALPTHGYLPGVAFALATPIKVVTGLQDSTAPTLPVLRLQQGRSRWNPTPPT